MRNERVASRERSNSPHSDLKQRKTVGKSPIKLNAEPDSYSALARRKKYGLKNSPENASKDNSKIGQPNQQYPIKIQSSTCITEPNEKKTATGTLPSKSPINKRNKANSIKSPSSLRTETDKLIETNLANNLSRRSKDDLKSKSKHDHASSSQKIPSSFKRNSANLSNRKDESIDSNQSHLIKNSSIDLNNSQDKGGILPSGSRIEGVFEKLKKDKEDFYHALKEQTRKVSESSLQNNPYLVAGGNSQNVSSSEDILPEKFISLKKYNMALKTEVDELLKRQKQLCNNPQDSSKNISSLPPKDSQTKINQPVRRASAGRPQERKADKCLEDEIEVNKLKAEVLSTKNNMGELEKELIRMRIELKEAKDSLFRANLEKEREDIRLHEALERSLIEKNKLENHLNGMNEHLKDFQMIFQERIDQLLVAQINFLNEDQLKSDGVKALSTLSNELQKQQEVNTKLLQSLKEILGEESDVVEDAPISNVQEENLDENQPSFLTERSHLKSEIKRLEKELAEKAIGFNEKEEEIIRLKEINIEKENQLLKIQEECLKLQEELKKVNEGLEKSKRETEEFQAKINEFAFGNFNLNEELEKLRFKYSEELDKKSKEVLGLREALEELNDLKEANKDQIERLENKLEKLVEEHNEYRKTVEIELNKYKENNQASQSELERYIHGDGQEANKIYEETVSENQSSKVQIEEITNKGQEFDELKRINIEYQKEKEELKKLRKEDEDHILRLNEELENLRNELETVKVDQQEKEKNSFEDQIKESENLRKIMEELKHELKEKDEDLHKIRNEKNKEIETLKINYEELIAEYEVFRKDNQPTAENLDTIKNQKINELNSRIESMTEQEHQTNTKLISLEEQIKEQSLEKERLEKEKDEIVKHLSQKLAQFEDQRALESIEFNQQKELMQAQYNKLKEEFSSLKNKYEESNQKRENENIILQEESAKVEDMHKLHSLNIEKTEELTNKLILLEKEKADLEEKLASAEIQKKKFENEKDNQSHLKEHEDLELNTRLQELELSKKTLEDQLFELKNSLESKNSQIEELTRNNMETIDTLKLLEIKENEIQHLQHQLEDTQKIKMEIYEASIKERESFLSEFERLNQEKQRREKLINEMDEKVKKYEEEVSKIKQEKEELEDHIKTLQIVNNNLVNEKQQLHQEVLNLTEKLSKEDTSTKLERMLEENQELKRRISENEEVMNQLTDAKKELEYKLDESKKIEKNLNEEIFKIRQDLTGPQINSIGNESLQKNELEKQQFEQLLQDKEQVLESQKDQISKLLELMKEYKIKEEQYLDQIKELQVQKTD